MFEMLMVAVERANKELKGVEDTNWSKEEIEKYKIGYTNGFFDIISDLRINGFITESEDTLIQSAFNCED